MAVLALLKTCSYGGREGRAARVEGGNRREVGVDAFARPATVRSAPAAVEGGCVCVGRLFENLARANQNNPRRRHWRALTKLYNKFVLCV